MDKLIFQSSFLLFVLKHLIIITLGRHAEEFLLWDTCIQKTPPFMIRQIWFQKNVHIISVSVTSIEGHIYSAERDNISRVPKPRFNLSLGVEHHSELKT